MEINIYDPKCNSSEIEGFTIVVDVFRAFTVSYFIAENKPSKYIVVDDIDKAFSLAKVYDNSILIGERNGIRIEGFHYGNSPTEIVGKNFANKIVIHTTSAGTKGLLRQSDKNEVVVGSFVNAKTLINYILSNEIDKVNIYCTANIGDMFGEEDFLFANYIKNELLNKGNDYDNIVNIL
jgi:2-phosphosulfolactate phosphatase